MIIEPFTNINIGSFSHFIVDGIELNCIANIDTKEKVYDLYILDADDCIINNDGEPRIETFSYSKIECKDEDNNIRIIFE